MTKEIRQINTTNSNGNHVEVSYIVPSYETLQEALTALGEAKVLLYVNYCIALQARSEAYHKAIDQD